MTLTLDLSPELEQYLLQEAKQQGLSVEALALQLLVSSSLLKQKQTKAIQSGIVSLFQKLQIQNFYGI